MTALATLRRTGGLSRPSWEAVSATLQSRSNLVRNDSMQGAVAGSPGTDATNWSSTHTGLTRTITRIGTYQGVDFIGLNLVGTTGATFGVIEFDTAGWPTVAGETWSVGAFMRVNAGSLANVSAIRFTMTSVNGTVIAPTSQWERLVSTVVIGADATRIPRLALFWSSGVAIDLELWIGWPHARLGSDLGSPIRTTTAARSGVHVSAGR